MQMFYFRVSGCKVYSGKWQTGNLQQSNRIRCPGPGWPLLPSASPHHLVHLDDFGGEDDAADGYKLQLGVDDLVSVHEVIEILDRKVDRVKRQTHPVALRRNPVDQLELKKGTWRSPGRHSVRQSRKNTLLCVTTGATGTRISSGNPLST